MCRHGTVPQPVVVDALRRQTFALPRCAGLTALSNARAAAGGAGVPVWSLHLCMRPRDAHGPQHAHRAGVPPPVPIHMTTPCPWLMAVTMLTSQMSTTYERIRAAAISKGGDAALAQQSGFDMLQMLVDGDEPRPQCAICCDALGSAAGPDDEILATRCVHLFCRSCLSAHANFHAMSGDASAFPCPLCRSRSRCAPHHRGAAQQSPPRALPHQPRQRCRPRLPGPSALSARRPTPASCGCSCGKGSSGSLIGRDP